MESMHKLNNVSAEQGGRTSGVWSVSVVLKRRLHTLVRKGSSFDADHDWLPIHGIKGQAGPTGHPDSPSKVKNESVHHRHFIHAKLAERGGNFLL